MHAIESALKHKKCSTLSQIMFPGSTKMGAHNDGGCGSIKVARSVNTPLETLESMGMPDRWMFP